MINFRISIFILIFSRELFSQGIISDTVDSVDNVISEECTADAAQLLDVDPLNIPESFVTCAAEVSASKNKPNPDTGKTTDQIITSHGYPVQIHNNVITDDGYILTIIRIPREGRTPIFLQHGMGGSSDNWVLIANNSLAFILADLGYDVWLGNFRGTSYSLGHKTLRWDNPTDFSYWDFSWHEMGIFDLPAVFNYITEITHQPKLHYIGHSMGTTAMLVALSQVPKITEKLASIILLTTAGFLGRSTSPIRLIAPLVEVLDPKYLETVLQGRFQKPDDYLHASNTTLANFCTPTATRCTACAYFIFALFGMDAPQMNYTVIPNFADRSPNSISVKSVYHYGQSMIECTFRQFNYGPDKNKQKYGSSLPPDYTIKSCGDVPIYSFYAPFDNLCRPKDVQRTMDLLPEGCLKKNTMIQSHYFNHIDVVIAKDVVPLLYTKIVTIVKSILLP